MARPTSIRDEDILAAARRVFLERGIRATSAEVAAQAQVSEGSIFKRFRSKEELFHAALQVDVEANVAFAESLLDRVGGDVRAHLSELGTRLLAMFRVVLPVMMMRWSNPEIEPSCPGGEAAPPVRLFAALVRYLRAEAVAGRLGHGDVETLARAFVGGIQHHVFFEVLLRVTPERRSSDAAVVARLVDALWQGCAPLRRSEQRPGKIRVVSHEAVGSRPERRRTPAVAAGRRRRGP